MTTTLPNPLFQSAVQLPELLAVFERGVHGTIEAWNKQCKDVFKTGDSETLHGYRDAYEAELAGQLRVLDGCLALAGRDGEAELTARLTATRDQLATHYNSLFPKWQTLDDLEDILLAPLSLPNEVLLELAKRYPPPQSWFEETIDPFEPAEGSPS